MHAAILLTMVAASLGAVLINETSVDNPYLETAPNCCVVKTLEVCSPLSAQYNVTDQGCAVACKNHGHDAKGATCSDKACYCQ